MDKLMEAPELAIALIFSLVGLILLLLGLVYYLEAKQSLRWRTSKGVILTSDVSKGTSTNTHRASRINYKPEICYSYEVGREKYVSNRIKILFNYATSSSARAFRLTNKYPKDSEVIVYYNPQKPKVAVIEPGVTNDIYVLMIIGLIIMITCLIIAEGFGLKDMI